MTATPGAMRRTFESLQIKNYRLYFIGQGISLTGTWIQRVAQAWLVLDLTGSGTAVGLVTALQFLPVLVLGPIGGVIADRVNKRRMLLATQSLALLCAAVLGVVVLAGVVQLWMVYALAFALGMAAAIDNPTRQTFVMEMVGRDRLTNALSLHSTLVNAARVVGPAVAGVLIVTVGIGWCFMFNALSYVAVIVALNLMSVSDLDTPAPQPRRRGQLREGWRYIRATPTVLTPLLMMAIAGTFAYEYQVVLPLLARFSFSGDAKTFAAMTSAMGAGAVVGGLYTASRQNRPAIALARTGAVFGIVQMTVAIAPTLFLTLALLVLLGAAGVAFIALGNSTLQLSAAPEMRGRVMGFWAVAFLGSTPIGGPTMGWIGEHFSPRWSLALGGAAVLIAAALAVRSLTTIDRERGPSLTGDEAYGPPPAKL